MNPYESFFLLGSIFFALAIVGKLWKFARGFVSSLLTDSTPSASARTERSEGARSRRALPNMQGQ